VPDHEDALEGIKLVAETVKSRDARAQDHYIKGVAALGEQLYGTTWYHMVNAIEFNPDLDKAVSQRDFANRLLVEDRYHRAKELEADGSFCAALSEYRELRKTTDLDGLDSRIAHMEKEVEVQSLVGEAEMQAFKRHFDQAQELLEKALGTTVSQQAEIGDLLILVKERDLEDRYQKAGILELENRLEESLAAYREIDETWPGFKEVKTRISDLVSTIEIAENAYRTGQEAEHKGDLQAAIDAYSEALLVYPGFKKLDAVVETLRQKLELMQ